MWCRQNQRRPNGHPQRPLGSRPTWPSSRLGTQCRYASTLRFCPHVCSIQLVTSRLTGRLRTRRASRARCRCAYRSPCCHRVPEIEVIGKMDTAWDRPVLCIQVVERSAGHLNLQRCSWTLRTLQARRRLPCTNEKSLSEHSLPDPLGSLRTPEHVTPEGVSSGVHGCTAQAQL
jgi:hypothetical protein